MSDTGTSISESEMTPSDPGVAAELVGMVRSNPPSMNSTSVVPTNSLSFNLRQVDGGFIVSMHGYIDSKGYMDVETVFTSLDTAVDYMKAKLTASAT